MLSLLSSSITSWARLLIQIRFYGYLGLSRPHDAFSLSLPARNSLSAGIESCDPRVAQDAGYVLCLDDDVAMHPGSLEELVGDLEEQKHAFIATGTTIRGEGTNETGTKRGGRECGGECWERKGND